MPTPTPESVFDATTREWACRLVEASERVPLRMSDFLQQAFFNESLGRALIVHPDLRCAYFYIRPQAYEDSDLLAAETKALIDLFMVLARLTVERHIHVFRSSNPGQQPLIFNERFQRFRNHEGRIVLNKRGDYLCEPRVIHDADGGMLYRGIRIHGEMFDLLHEQLRGVVCVAPSCRALIDPAPTRHARFQRVTKALRIARFMLNRHVLAALMLAGAAVATLLPMQPGDVAGGLLPRPLSSASSSATPAPQPNDSGLKPAAPLVGFDLSKWNGPEGDDLIDNGHVNFVFARAGYGLRSDPAFPNYWSRLSRRTLFRGAYHFFLYDEDPVEQARFFIRLLGQSSSGELCPAVDFEELSLPRNGEEPARTEIEAKLMKFLNTVEELSGCTPIIYTDVSMGNRYLNHPSFSRYPLWIADWTQARNPQVPLAWKHSGFHFWQKSTTYVLANGQRTPTDFDTFAGSPAQLARLTRPIGLPASSAAPPAGSVDPVCVSPAKRGGVSS